MKQYYAGIDIHKEKYVGCVMQENGKIAHEGSFPPTREAAQGFFCGMPIKAIAIESCGMWRHAMKMFRDLGYTVKLTSPNKTKDIAGKKKTDKVDARILANLLRTGFLPEVYIPNNETLRLRDIARHKSNLTRMKTEIQRKIKSYLLREGVPYRKNIWTVKGLEWLKQVDDPNVQNWLRLYHNTASEEKEVMSRIRNISRNGRLTNLLMTMPGIAEFSALMIMEEIADISRFPTPKHLVMYAGLCPGVYQTGNTEYNVRNYAVNKHLKWIVTECSGRAAMIKGTRFQKHYAKLYKKKGFKVARRSTARKMLVIIWHMLTNQETYAS